jgi:hypothetical protein
MIKGFTHMFIAPGMFAQSVDEADDPFGFSLRFPTLDVEGDVVFHGCGCFKCHVFL